MNVGTEAGGGAGASRRRCEPQQGLTLIEMVVTLALIAIAVVGIAYAFSAVVRGSGTAQEQAALDTAAKTAAAYLQNPALAYSPCATASTYRLPAPPAQVTWSVSAVFLSAQGSLRRSSGAATASNASSTAAIAACPDGADDYGVQEITVRVCMRSHCLDQAIWKGVT